MNLAISKNDFDSYIPLIISFFGWLVLFAFLYYHYTQTNKDILTLISTSGGNTQAVYTILIFFSPVISSIVGYLVNRRLQHYRTQYLNELRIKNLAVEELFEIIDSLIISFVNALDAKSPWTKGHSLRVRHYSMLIARQMSLGESQVEILNIAALLHDIGKIGTYDDVLNKVEPLTEEEFELIKKHPDNAVNILHPIKRFRVLLPYIKSHHERMDGCGYPDGLTGKEIPFLSRIICVADAYDAITSARPYKTKMSKEEAIRILQQKTETQFDRRVVAALVAIHNKPGFDFVE